VMVEPASAHEFQAPLAALLGADAASVELSQALADLNMVPGERRPAQLGRLRERLQRNLSGLMGPLVARWVVDRSIRVDHAARAPLSDRIRALEEQLRASRAQLQGAPAELEAYRRYLRRVLEDLPLGVCALGPDRDVVIWNRALEQCSGLSSLEVVGVSLEALQGPLAESLRAFVAGKQSQTEVHVEVNGKARSFSLSRSQVREPATASAETTGIVVLVEDLTERNALAAQVAHQDRLASVGRLAAGVAHEIGNPLTGIACLAQNLSRDTTSADVRERLGQILSEAQRIDAIVRVLLGYSHAGTAHGLRRREPVDLRACVGEATTLVRLSHEAKSVHCESRIPEGLVVSGDRQRLEQVFVNLIANACDASSPGAWVTVDAEPTSGGITVSVRDRGTGMDEAVRSRMFEPFYTTKPPGQGTGLGLPLAAAIVREHGGTLRVESWPGVGTTVEVELPVGSGTRVAEALGGARA